MQDVRNKFRFVDIPHRVAKTAFQTSSTTYASLPYPSANRAETDCCSPEREFPRGERVVLIKQDRLVFDEPHGGFFPQGPSAPR